MKMKFVRVSVDDNEKFSSLFKWFVELGRNEKKGTAIPKSFTWHFSH